MFRRILAASCSPHGGAVFPDFYLVKDSLIFNHPTVTVALYVHSSTLSEASSDVTRLLDGKNDFFDLPWLDCDMAIGRAALSGSDADSS
jgi:hypothetical protein